MSDTIGTRHTIKLCTGRSIAVQATKTGQVMLEIIDRTGAADSIDAMSLDPMTAGAVAFAIEQAGEAIEADKARRLRMAHELTRAGHGAVMQWRTTPAGLLVPAKPATWPRPAGWDQLPAEVRAAWDARWAAARAGGR